MNTINRKHIRVPVISLLLAGTGLLCALCGCRSLPQSGFDPSGERLFESCPLNSANCNLFGRKKDTPPVTTETSTAGTPAQPEGASVYNPNPIGTPASTLPGDFGAGRSNDAVPAYGSTATAAAPGFRGINTAIIASPETDITTPVFEDTGGYALPTIPVEGPAMIMTPREQIAPVGSEVVLISSYLGTKDRLITNEKVEWTLEGVGTIENFDAGSCCDPLFFDYVKAKKVTDRYAVTKTSQVYQTLDRGTPDTNDDIHLLRGQTWVSVNSMKEGTTHVTAFAPAMNDWSKRTDVGIIHWVDAQWVIPRLAIAPVGETRALTTTVLRQTNGQPRSGWIVRYEILNGPPAGFGQSSMQIEEVATDLSGQATVLLTPRDQQAGTNTIAIRIIRPAGVDGSDRRVTVGSETVRQTWSGTPNILVNIKGPNDAKIGQELPYQITVQNRTSAFVQGVVALPVPPLASYIRSTPAAQQQGSTLLWNVDLQPNSTSEIALVLRQGSAGSLWLRPEFRHQGSRIASSTVTGPVPSQTIPPRRNPPKTVDNTAKNTPPEAERFPGRTATTPTQPPPTDSAAVFQPQQKQGLNLQIQIDPTTKVEYNKPFNFYFTVKNNATAEVRNVRLQIPLPQEFRGQTILAASNPKGEAKNYADRNVVELQVPSIQPGGSAHIQLQYPTIGQQGYTLTGEVYVNDQFVDRVTQKVMPGN
ncbi:hypothetical protein FACS1894189_7850 [Planctomycetales bacterium]|nr:hypothetical protein FACS1894189_7850 [Planctomycetales bacterium]